MHGIHLNITVQRRLENRLLSLKTYRHLIVNRESTIKYDSFKKKKRENTPGPVYLVFSTFSSRF